MSVLPFFNLSGVRDFAGEFSKAKFLHLGTIDILSPLVLGFGAYRVHYGVFNSIPGF